MPGIRKKYDREFREGAVRIVEETGKSIAAVARDLGVNEGTLGNWVARAREARKGTQGLSSGDCVEAQAGEAAFGSVCSRVRNSWAAVTRVTWRCQPAKVRPSKWSRPRPVFGSR